MIRHLPDLPAAAAAVLLLAVVALSPLPFGSVLPRDRAALEAASFLALLLLLVARRDADALGAAAAPAAAVAGVGVFGLAQSLSWPGWLAELAAPSGAALWRDARALLDEPGGWVPLSVSPAVSRSTALLWLAAAAAMAAAAILARERRLRRLLGAGLLATAIFEISYGAERWFERSSEIWGRQLPGGGARLRGTFVNPDHFAMFLTVALAACFAWAWWSAGRAQHGGAPLERRLLLVVLPWFFFVMLFVGLAFTGSRGGFLGGLTALLAQALALGLRERNWRAALPGLGAVALGLASLLYFGWQQGMGRWIETSAYDVAGNVRRTVVAESLELWWRFPWTGTGLGTFRQAFPLVQPAELELTWFHAHSDVVEALVTTGLAGAALLLWGGTVLARRLWRLLRYGRRSEDRAMVLAAWGALAGVLAHASVDFGLTLPANAFLVAVVLGLACGVASRDPSPQAPSASASASAGHSSAGRDREGASSASSRSSIFRSISARRLEMPWSHSGMKAMRSRRIRSISRM
ncbi:MAG TPA: O-antigen ligase family protein [Thermoanaerobaculia bacterium]|jgi:hypothetical protein